METKTATTFNPCDDCPKDGNTCPVCTLENAVAAGFENRARISQLEAQLEFAEQALAAAREENERLRELEENEDRRRRLGNAEYQINFMLTSISKITGVEAKSPVDAVHHVFDLMGYCKNRDEQLAALRSRADDAGRVERVMRELQRQIGELEEKGELDCIAAARAVLAAAYERGAREFAEWCGTNGNRGAPLDTNVARFLVSLGTGIAESKREEG